MRQGLTVFVLLVVLVGGALFAAFAPAMGRGVDQNVRDACFLCDGLTCNASVDGAGVAWIYHQGKALPVMRPAESWEILQVWEQHHQVVAKVPASFEPGCYTYWPFGENAQKMPDHFCEE